MTWKLKEIYNELVELEEHQRIEAKLASEIGDSIMQTICAFANEPGLGGGWLLLGVSEPDDKHDTFWVKGINDVDKILSDLQNNCRNQFEQPIAIECKHEKIDNLSVIGVFIPELDPVSKPCRFTGKFHKHNKKKTGVWRRGANGDYECSEKELESILLAKMGTGFEQFIPSDVSSDDIDFDVIQLYRVLRSKVRPSAEELQVDSFNMLHALQLTKKKSNEYLPNLAGLILFGKAISLRRLLPAIRVDYIRIQGTEWVEDPEQRFTTTLDLREPMIRLISRLETIILDDMPYHFQLEEGKIQRTDQPLLPQKVIREAVVNSLMHRDYCVNQPILIVRYRNRLEILNPGYSLKPISELDQMGSKQRNPIIASVLYDLSFAETKGSGIRTMQNLLEKVGLTKPVFASNRESNQFTAIFLLHQLLDEEQLQWLIQFSHLNLSNDEAKALVLIKEMRAIDNAALRAVTDLDILSASRVLRKLSLQYKLIEKGGNGSASYYKPTKKFLESISFESALPNKGDLGSNKGDLGSNKGDLGSNKGDLSDELLSKIGWLTPKVRGHILRPIIVELCLINDYTAQELGEILEKDIKSLKSSHLTPMRKEGLIEYLYPKVVNHPEQAYKTTNKGKKWLEKQPGFLFLKSMNRDGTRVISITPPA